MPTSLSHLFVPVRDREAARRLFVDVLGLEVLVEGGGYLRVGGGGGFSMGIEQGQSDDPKLPELVIRVDDVDAMAERLRAAGFDVSEPADQEWGARHAWFPDPDGRPISIYTPLDGA